MHTNLYLGTEVMDITPAWSVPLAGFASRKDKGPFEGVSQPLYAKVFVFMQQDDISDKQLALLISADLIWWGSERMGPLKRKICDTWGFKESSIIFHGTHTHSGPQTSDCFTPSLGLVDKAYIDILELKVMQGIDKALNSLEPVSIESGQGLCHISIHRRKKIDGKIALAPNQQGPTDPEVNVVRFNSLNGKTKAVLVHYACHPTITSSNWISSEFCGAAMEEVENSIGNGAVVAYLQGCCGDIAPIAYKEGVFIDGQEQMVKKLGHRLADEVLRILLSPMKSLTPEMLPSKKVIVELALQKLPTVNGLRARLDEQGIYGEWSRLLLDRGPYLAKTIPLEMTLIRIAQGFSLVAMNAEVVVQYGLFIKQCSNRTIWPLAYSNGMIGYIPTEQQLLDGGYEAYESTFYFGMPAPLEASIEKLIYKELKNLLAYC